MNATQRAQAICEITAEKRRDDAQEIAHERQMAALDELAEQSQGYYRDNGKIDGETSGKMPGEARTSEVEARADALAKLIGRPDLAGRLQQNMAISDHCDTGLIVDGWMKHGY